MRATTNVKRLYLPIWLLAAACSAWAQGALEVITLRHRTAEQVIPVLQPLLEPGGAIRGQRAASTASGRLGEWMELGGVSSASASSGGGMPSSRGGEISSDRRIWVKVEEIR
ncbi:MAG TPA: hypothetical protein VMT02_06400 [Burkholderiales bacterium]|nr:hypothetical protein [Burkholderiales bacterium]